MTQSLFNDVKKCYNYNVCIEKEREFNMDAQNMKENMLQPGRPKVAVPIVSAAPADIIEECERIVTLPCDVIEWRADYYLAAVENLDEHLKDMNGYLDIVKILDDIEYIAAGKPVIFTIRSSAQGGQVQLTRQQLESVYGLVAQSGLAEYVDIELYDAEGVLHEEWVKNQIEEIHQHGGKVILSHHDFEKTPQPAELAQTVKKMYEAGADLCKAAVMANSKEDAMNLLKVTAFLNKKGIGPLAIMAMGEHGKSTRVAAGRYGSCLTFASGSEASAPGQVDTYTMKQWLDAYYG